MDRLYPGNIQLTEALQPLVLAAEQTLELDKGKRNRTVLRVDAGGGSLDDVNWLLERGYQVHCKDYSSVRAEALAMTVKQWYSDPQCAGRQVGWVEAEALDYVRPVRRLALRWRLKNGQWRYGVIISTLERGQVIKLLGLPVDRVKDPRAAALAYAKFYDQRGGGVETEFKQDKQGVGMCKRSKKKFAAQQMVMLLGALAHNVLIWARRWLSAIDQKLAEYGVLRLVRDVLTTSGFVELDKTGSIKRIVLNQTTPLARRLAEALKVMLQRQLVGVSVGQT